MQIPVPPPPDFDRLYPDGDAAATQAVMNIIKTSDLLLARVQQATRHTGVSPAGGLVLGILFDAAGPQSPGYISERLIVTRATVTGLIDSLEKRDMVRRRPHPNDRRMLLVELTPLGRQTCTELRAAVHRQEAAWLSGLSAAERKSLIDLLAAVQKSLLAAPG